MTGKVIGRGEGAGKCLDSGRIWSRHVRAVPAHIQVPTKKVIRKVQFQKQGFARLTIQPRQTVSSVYPWHVNIAG